MTLAFSQDVCYSMTIVSPQNKEKITAGSSIKVQVKADAGEQLAVVIMPFAKPDENFTFNSASGLYEKIIGVPTDIFGLVKIDVVALDQQGAELEANVNVEIVMPPNITLKTLNVYDDEKLLFFPRIGAVNRLHVTGVFSDGIVRDLDTASSGTTFTSSDTSIVTVTPDGKVESKKNGKATITITNGTVSLKVQALVQVSPSKY
jgi:hypothetical protein